MGYFLGTGVVYSLAVKAAILQGTERVAELLLSRLRLRDTIVTEGSSTDGFNAHLDKSSRCGSSDLSSSTGQHSQLLLQPVLGTRGCLPRSPRSASPGLWRGSCPWIRAELPHAAGPALGLPLLSAAGSALRGSSGLRAQPHMLGSQKKEESLKTQRSALGILQDEQWSSWANYCKKKQQVGTS